MAMKDMEMRTDEFKHSTGLERGKGVQFAFPAFFDAGLQHEVKTRPGVPCHTDFFNFTRMNRPPVANLDL
jgi:hypothetical protein